MISRSLVSTAALALVLAGPAAAFSPVPDASAPLPLLLAQADDPAARVEAAQEEFEAALQALQEAQQGGGDVESAQARLDAAQEELRAAQEAAAEQPTDQAEQPTEEAEQPAEEAEQPTEDSEQPAEEAEQLTEEAEQLTDEAEQPTEDVEQLTEPPVELDQTEPTDAPVELQQTEPTEPPVELEQTEPTEPPVELQQADPTEPPVELQQTEPVEPPAGVQEAQPTQPPVEQRSPDAQRAPEQAETPEGEAEPRSLLEGLREQATPEAVPEQQADPDGERRGRDGRPDGQRGFELQAEPAETGEGRRDGPRRAGDLLDRVPEGADVVRREGDRIIIQQGDQIFIRKDENDRIRRFGREVETEQLRGGWTRTIVTRRNGVQVITVRDEYGEIVRRARHFPDGREVVLFDVREERREPRRDWDNVLPPLVVEIPRHEYIVEMDRASEADIREALIAPPVEEVERVYTLQEVRQSERLRDKVRRVDLDTITFEFNSADIARDQIPALASVGDALEDVLADNPDEVYLIEGHTDAVGSDLYNLELSDRRAESVAIALSENFDIPPENLVTQGYGEQYLKVPTEEQERQNRRVTIRRITPLITSER